MNKKRLFALLLCGIIVSSSMAGCVGKRDKTVDESTSQSAAVSVVETIEAVEVEQEIVSFEDKDKDGNTLKLSPVFDNDGDTLFAGYIMSVTDKSGKALDAKAYPLLGCIVKAKRDGNTGKIEKNTAGALTKIESYADEQGNLLAIVDSYDLDGDQDTTELLKVAQKVDGNGITKNVVEYTTVTLEKAGDKAYIIDGSKKTPVKSVDSTNTAVQKQTQTEVKKNEIKKEEVKKEQSSTTKPSTTKPTTKPSGNGGTTTTQPVDTDIAIVLKRNSKADCSSNKVDIENAKVTIHDEGDYVITSETDTWHGRIVVKLPNDKACSIKFKDVDISYNNGNILQIIDTSIDSDRTFLEREVASTDEAADNELQNVSESDSAPNVDISFPEGTHSSFTSSANSYTGVVYNESKLTIKGNGRLSIESTTNADNCICSTKSVTIKNCTVSLATAHNTNPSKLAAGTGSAKGIFCYNKVKLESGSLTVKTNGDAIRCSRFIMDGGTASITSSACDALDTDNEITINAGKITAIGIEKSAYKVRRINADKQRDGKNDTFEINGGTVIGECKKSSQIQMTSSQKSLMCTIKSTNPSKTYGTKDTIVIKADGSTVASTTNPCTTFIYSTSSVSSSTAYQMLALDKTANVRFSGPKMVGVMSMAG